MNSFRWLAGLVVWCCMMNQPLCAQSGYTRLGAFLKANSQWAFGIHLGLDLNEGARPYPTSMWSGEGCASVSSADSGRLLFYSNGNTCWNSAHNVMPNGGGLLGNTSGSTSQGVCIVQQPDAPYLYYLFSMDGAGTALVGSSTKGNLWYSVIDMRLDSGRGDIVAGRKNILLDSLLSESMIAVPGLHCDVWMMVHALDSPLFKAYHITAAGLDPNPVLSQAGPPMQSVVTQVISGGRLMDFRLNYLMGCMAVSPDRKMIAIATMDMHGPIYATPVPAGAYHIGAVLCRFDAATGQVSDGIRITDRVQPGYGVCFSPDNSKLYVNSPRSDNTTTFPNGIYQYEVGVYDSAAIVQSRTLVRRINTNWASYLKLYRDTIYISNDSVNAYYLARINRPDMAGPSCGYQPAAVSVFSGSGGMSIANLPNDVGMYIPDTIRSKHIDTVACFASRGHMLVSADIGGWDYRWNDGDTGRTRTIYSSDTFIVRYRTAGCLQHIDTFITAFYAPPTVRGTYDCKAWILQPVRAVPGIYTYTWYDDANNLLRTRTGSITGDTISGLKLGVYYVKATTPGGCDTTLRVTVKPLFRAAFTVDTPLCSGLPVLFRNTSVGNPPVWRWDFGDHATSGLPGPEHIYAAAGRYTVSLQVGGLDAACADTATHEITVTDFVLHLTATDTLIDKGDAVTLETYADQHYRVTSWLPAHLFTDQTAFSQTVHPDSTLLYVVTGMSDYGCPDTAELRVWLNAVFFVPTAFTPNGDGKNDYFRPVFSGPSAEIRMFRVFDRWGKQVWEASGSAALAGWDGTYDGVPAQIGVYYFAMELLHPVDGKRIRQQGDVTLSR